METESVVHYVWLWKVKWHVYNASIYLAYILPYKLESGLGIWIIYKEDGQ